MKNFNIFICKSFQQNFQEVLIQPQDNSIRVERSAHACGFHDGCSALAQCMQAYDNADFRGLVVCGESGNVMKVSFGKSGQAACQVIANFYHRDFPTGQAELADGSVLLRQTLDKQVDGQVDIDSVDLQRPALALRTIINEYAMDQTKSYTEEEINRLNALRINYEKVLGMADEMVYQNGEQALSGHLIHCFETLLYPCKCTYYCMESGSEAELPMRIKETISGDHKHRIWWDEGLLVLKVTAAKEVLGAVEVSGILPFEYVDKQMNQLLHLANVAGLCLSNIRKEGQLASSESKYKHLSMSDSLTGIYNRRYFHKRLGKIKADISYWPVAIFVCDIDKLKSTNDNRGHLEGDKLIIKAAEVLKKSFPEGTICRIGGDEFSVILDSTGYNEVIDHYQKLKGNLELMNQTDGEPLLSLSVGYAYCDDFKCDMEALFHEADQKMYREKERHSIAHL